MFSGKAKEKYLFLGTLKNQPGYAHGTYTGLMEGHDILSGDPSGFL
jgi:hypothetical protein